jgi:hypothetical protein
VRRGSWRHPDAWAPRLHAASRLLRLLQMLWLWLLQMLRLQSSTTRTLLCSGEGRGGARRRLGPRECCQAVCSRVEVEDELAAGDGCSRMRGLLRLLLLVRILGAGSWSRGSCLLLLRLQRPLRL